MEVYADEIPHLAVNLKTLCLKGENDGKKQKCSSGLFPSKNKTSGRRLKSGKNKEKTTKT